MEKAMRQRNARPHEPREQPSDWRATASASSLTTTLLTALVAIGAFAQDARSENGQEAPFDVANVFAELNNTDGDLGLHALIDGEAWKLLEIEAPNERQILLVRPTGSLARQGLTELFFESAEPPFDELSPEEFFDRFPEGPYEISGRTIEGHELESTVQFTHVLPAPADGISVSGTPIDPDALDCEVGPLPSVSEPVSVSWDPVTNSHPEIGRTGEMIEVVKYQVVVEVLQDDPNPPIYSIDLPPAVTEIEVPSEFIDLGDEFKLEILVREASGNQTAIETCFATEE
jgi:hypothetical protein